MVTYNVKDELFGVILSMWAICLLSFPIFELKCRHDSVRSLFMFMDNYVIYTIWLKESQYLRILNLWH